MDSSEGLMMKKYFLLPFVAMLHLCLLAPHGWSASSTRLFDIRFGQHTGFSRLVIDSAGARPLKIGPVSAQGLPIVFDQLEVVGDKSKIFGEMRGAVARVSLDRGNNQPMVSVIFKRPNTQVKSFFMKGQSSTPDSYRLVLDIYPEGNRASGPGTTVPLASAVAGATVAAAATALSKTSPPPTVIAASSKAQTSPSAKQPISAPASAISEASSTPAATTTVAAESSDATATGEVQNSQPPAPAEEQEEEAGDKMSFADRFSGEATLIGRPYISGDDESSNFTQYGEYNNVTGAWSIKYSDLERYFFSTNAANVGQDNQYYFLGGGRYGKFKIGMSYDEIPHKYAFNQKTLYSGVGSQTLLLSDALQSDLQGLAGDPVAQADQLNTAYATANIGDPQVQRKDLALNMDLVALDPFSLRIEFAGEKQEGTRPLFGSFSLNNAMELFEPVNNETFDMKFIAEYAKKAYFLNATYYFQNFNNKNDTLTFDNPFRVDDTLFGPSNGRLDLAPDNNYQNISLSGSYMDLPFRTRLSGTAAWGWMSQDDALIPFTTNSALATPGVPIDYTSPSSLPTQKADVKVNTALYQLALSSNPLAFMHVKGNFRYYNYDNDTDPVAFPDGYVNSDSFPVVGVLPNPISTLPSSYSTTKADIDVGFDIWTQTRLNLKYTYNLIERTNREVDRQHDNIFGVSIDSNRLDWLGWRLAYDRTETDINNYIYDIYLKGGQDLEQLPALRKYDQADVSRDRLRFTMNLYPTDQLNFGGSFVYGRDNFSDSPYGLTSSKYYSFSLDAGYALTDRMDINAFWVYEKYKNEQIAQGGVDANNDGLLTVTDWLAEGQDEINTFGLGVKYALIPKKLDFDLSYSFTKTDGSIDFDIPVGEVDNFDMVNDSTLNALDTRLTYNFFKNYYFILGYYWERFDYDDYNTQGFTNVPTDASGAYNGALLSDSLWEPYNAYYIYTNIAVKF